MEVPSARLFPSLAKFSIICLCLLSFTVFLPTTAFPYGTAMHGRIAHHAFDLFDTPELRVYQNTIEQWAVDADRYSYNSILGIWWWPETPSGALAARDHFWNPDDNRGLWYVDQTPCKSAAEKADEYWQLAIDKYRAALQAEKQGQDGSSFRYEAYKFLGNVAHLLTDMACPAHSHNDDHVAWVRVPLMQFEGSDYYENYTESHINPNWFTKPGLKPIQVSPDKNSIRNIMYNLAQRTQHFPSKSSEQIDLGHWGNDTKDNAYGVFDYSLDSWPSGWPNYTPDQLTDANDPGNARKEQMANILVPLAQSYVAGLYKTFWELFNISITVLDKDNYSVNRVTNLTKAKITGSGTINGLTPTYWEWDLDYTEGNFNPKPANCGNDKATIEPIIRTDKSQITIAVRASNGNEISRICTKTLNVGSYPINMSYPEGYDSYKRCFSPPSPDPSGLITKWEWNFGDGNLAEGRSQCHEYAVANFYTITLKVTDDQGFTYTSYDYTFAGPGTRYIQGHTITGNETWYHDGTYVVMGSINVAPGGSLTVESGVQVYLYSEVSISASGTLKATGATFTWADGAHEWGGIEFSGDGANSSRLERCVIEHGKGVSCTPWRVYYSLVSIANSSPTITDCAINGKGNGTEIFGILVWTDMSRYLSRPLITNNTVSSCTIGIVTAFPSAPSITSNTLRNNAGGVSASYGPNNPIINSNTYVDNTVDQYLTGNITTAVTWNDGGKYWLFEMSVGEGGSLTIASGRTITFPAGSWLSVSGTLKATGVNFTWDDGQNNWKGISFSGGSSDSRLEGCTIQHAGWNNNPVLSLSVNSATITGCTITGEASPTYTGIYLSGGTPVITNNTISGMSTAIQGNSGPYPVITGNTIQNNNLGIDLNNFDMNTIVTENTFINNISYAVSYSGSGTMNAPKNNWGHASGPLDNSDDRVTGGLFNPSGLGDRVSDKVNYYPWTGCTIGPTATPSGFKVTTEPTALNLTWNANTEPDLEGYIIYYGTAPGSYQASIRVGKVTSYQLTGLTTGQRYYLAISSINTMGVQSAIREISATPGQASQTGISSILYLLLLQE